MSNIGILIAQALTAQDAADPPHSIMFKFLEQMATGPSLRFEPVF
jgi:hypothetical protein